MKRELDVDRTICGQRRSRALGRAIAELARRQWGAVSREQLRDIGLSADNIDYMVAGSRLHVVHRGVYAVGHPLLPAEGRWRAALLAVGDGAVLSHRTAAERWKMLAAAGDVVEVTVPGDRRSRDGIEVHRNGLQRSDIRRNALLPVTTPARTLLDLAAATPTQTLEKALREAEFRRLVTPASLRAVVDAKAGRRGAAALREAVKDLGHGVTRNDFEHAFRKLVRRHGLPMPKFNASFAIQGHFVEPDALWRDQKLVVELDGRAAHLTSHAFEDDRARDRALQAAGYRVLRITWRQLHEDPVAIAAHLSALLIG